ncbi:MAG: 6,7-dimethyl-8-ribityllumazine synthase [Sodalis sp. (in: enterobacteria)]
MPVEFGVLIIQNIKQAVERVGIKTSNKGAETRLTALEIIKILASHQSVNKGKRNL